MPQTIHISDRDRAILQLLARTPATAPQLRTASETFPGEPYRDDRRTRERLQTLADAGLVRVEALAGSGGGALHCYHLTRAGADFLPPTPPVAIRREPTPLSRIAHVLAVADVLIHGQVAAHRSRIAIGKCHGDGQLRLEIGEHRMEPDLHFQWRAGQRDFNVLFEIDNATEPLDADRESSIRRKIAAYEAYQDWVLSLWQSHRTGPRPLFRVVFLTLSATRANHMLWLAGALARNRDRRLCYAGTQTEFLAEPLALTEPILLDHHGQWQPLVNTQPTSRATRSAVRLTPPVAVTFAV